MKLFHFISKIVRMGAASGGKRIAYAIGNAIIVAIAFAAGYFIYTMYSNLGNAGTNFAIYIVGIIVLAIIGVAAFFEGVICQIALTIFSLMGIIVSRERLANLFAFLITIATYAAIIITGVILLS